MAAKTTSTKPMREDRAMFSIGAETSAHLDYLVGRHVKADGTAGVSRTDVVRDLIERAFRAVTSRNTTRPRS